MLIRFIERPSQDITEQYFANPGSFLRANMATLSSMNDDELETATGGQLAETTIQCILEASICCNSIKDALIGSEDLKEQFKTLLWSRNQQVALVIAHSLSTLCAARSL